MIVEDAIVIRGLVTRILEEDPGIHIVSSAGDGAAALRSFKNTPADVIVLDIEMPVMDGLTALPQLLQIDPHARVLISSTLTQRGAEISMKALELGASDYLAKPTTSREMTAADDFKRDIVAKVKALGASARRAGVRGGQQLGVPQASAPASPHKPSGPDKISASAATPLAQPGKPVLLRPWPAGFRPEIVAIGSSTGGPQALFNVIKPLAGHLKLPVVITQHMPPAFTTTLADHISKQTGMRCKEAAEGDELKTGEILLAPGGYHMLVRRMGASPAKVTLTQDAPENFCRPAVDPMLRSIVSVFGKNVLTVILTGMGSDGAKGCEVVVKAGGAVLAQDEATSVVWGMPGAVAQTGACSALLPVNDIGPAILKLASGQVP
ncbi:MAG: chemotaxis response regulator protein-glutamate methylesterase [Alphaproteobacteria bacterium]|nr:chemotaxis response regulator protein-glutamate methylesterase [Alphaproteobacteria bacterium]NDC56187.1 chemotaxis response regulator protein-glutamate methylesterase [Alphaproteobacteria bacterium]NDG04556.1 chemotaxis response regulator protein-glutamate methylesterase [Alphaproteobacteria bacterium]